MLALFGIKSGRWQSITGQLEVAQGQYLRPTECAIPGIHPQTESMPIRNLKEIVNAGDGVMAVHFGCGVDVRDTYSEKCSKTGEKVQTRC